MLIGKLVLNRFLTLFFLMSIHKVKALEINEYSVHKYDYKEDIVDIFSEIKIRFGYCSKKKVRITYVKDNFYFDEQLLLSNVDINCQSAEYVIFNIEDNKVSEGLLKKVFNISNDINKKGGGMLKQVLERADSEELLFITSKNDSPLFYHVNINDSKVVKVRYEN